MSYRLMIGLVVWALIGCGIQGPPVPPEDVGIAGVAHRQKEMKAREEATRRAEEATQPAPEAKPVPEGEAEPLPLEGAALPSARPSGDVQVKPR